MCQTLHAHVDLVGAVIEEFESVETDVMWVAPGTQKEEFEDDCDHDGGREE